MLDTLHGESKRRYLETLSPYAADMLGGRRVIPLDSAEGLPASLAIGPSHGESGAKSYALTISECDAPLRTLFAAFAKPACPVCGKAMASTSREDVIRQVASLPEGTKLQFFARIPCARQSLDKLSAAFLAQGFTRAVADGVVYSLADLTEAEREICPAEFFIVVDRIIVRANTRTRIAEAVDGVLRLTHSEVTVDENGARRVFSTVPSCPEHGVAELHGLEASDFSPYSRSAACPNCGGKGFVEIDGGVRDCADCGGLRLKKSLLNATVVGEEAPVSWQEILCTPFAELEPKLHRAFDGLLESSRQASLARLLNALADRIQAVNDLDIGYLTAGRAGATLSGGEIQRLRLAGLSTGHLNNLLIALDEPASGLHESDVDALWKVLKKVQARGNTLVLIEHNPRIIERADWIIEMGPGAGEKGGEVLFMGPRDEVLKNPASPTGNWIRELDERRKVMAERGASPARVSGNDLAICVADFALYDMQSVSANFPLKKFSVITGQSGSGKSTLMFKNLAPRAEAGEFASLGIDALSVLSTGDFHGTRRSTVLSATNMSNLLRDLFAKMPESKVRGYNAAKFATHTAGGRCENCKGEGVIVDPTGYEETECPVCLGRRFKDEILDIRFKSKSIADVLDMEIGEAYKLFYDLRPFAEKLKPLVDTGLDYLRLGQSTAHMSGGERARLRLSIALARAKAPNTLFLFDEPARGLHQVDIQHLLDLIHGLTQAGHTVIAIEHAQDFVDAADYVVKLKRP